MAKLIIEAHHGSIAVKAITEKELQLLSNCRFGAPVNPNSYEYSES